MTVQECVMTDLKTASQWCIENSGDLLGSVRLPQILCMEDEEAAEALERYKLFLPGPRARTVTAGHMMPQVTGPMLLQIALLLGALPAQYLIMQWTSGTAAQRRLATQGILDVWKGARKSYLNTTVWVDWVNSWMPKLPLLGAEEALEEMPGDIMELEILMRNNEFGYFAASRVPRSPRPEYVLHRVGEVVIETQNHMVGVIVGWDEGLRTPPEWLRRKKYTDSEVMKLKDTPHYKILFSGPDPSSLMIGYLPQYTLQLFEGYRPEIPTLEQYFSHFNGKKFVMHDWLEELYPED